MQGPSFDELHVISDLHFGGEGTGRQIFASTVELKKLIEELTAADAGRSLALAINGDFIDFLAERPAASFDPEGAIHKLERVMKDPSFEPVFAALSKFIAAANRTLIVNLGNHDLELALPWVKRRFIDALCAGDPTARSRLSVVSDGTGVRCQVRNATVLLAHGNEVDSWNVADFERIRRIGRDMQFGNNVAAWTPNAGTKMVIDVMNGIKRRYPFVDLLKPEKEAVVPVLLALDPGAVDKLKAVAAIAGRRAFDAARMATGFLGDPDDAPVSAAPLPTSAIYENRLDEAALMDRVEMELKRGKEPLDLVREQPDAQLGVWSATWNLLRGRPKHEVLRAALDKLDADRTFEIDEADDTFKQLDQLVGPEVDFVIAGHTHLERARRRTVGKGAYFNSGTWARLIQLTPAVRQDPVQFERIFNLFEGGTMDALDREPSLVVKRCSVVSIFADAAGRVHGELRRATGGGATNTVMVPVENSRFSKE